MTTSTSEEIGQARAVCFLCIADRHNRQLTRAERQFLSDCANDFLKLAKLRLLFARKFRREAEPILNMPDIRRMREHLERQEYAAALAEACDIRFAMQPLLVAASARVKDTLANRTEIKKIKNRFLRGRTNVGSRRRGVLRSPLRTS